MRTLRYSGRMTRLPGRRVARILTGPLCIRPIAFIVAFGTDRLIESNFNMIPPPGHVSFFRGSDDYGCSNRPVVGLAGNRQGSRAGVPIEARLHEESDEGGANRNGCGHQTVLGHLGKG